MGSLKRATICEFLRCRYALAPTTGRCTNSTCPNSENDLSECRGIRVQDFLRQDFEPPLYHGRRWGAWTLNVPHRTLEYMRNGIPYYQVDLMSCANSPQVLDWIFMVLGTDCGDPRAMWDLLNAFNDIFDPQANMCSFGVNKPVNPAEFLKQRFRNCGGEVLAMSPLIDLLRQLEQSRFYGSLEVKFEAGKVVLLRKTETMKPANCRINRGNQDDSTKSD